MNAIESLSERIVEYNQRIENLAQQSYPQVALLKQIKGVGTLIALTLARCFVCSNNIMLSAEHSSSASGIVADF